MARDRGALDDRCLGWPADGGASMKWILVMLMAALIQSGAQALEERHHDSGAPHREDDHHDEEEGVPQASSNVGPGKAVSAADAERGLQLTLPAVRRLGLETIPVSGKAPYAVPPEALVYQMD